MALRDSWHRALVYFGFAEEYPDELYEEEATSEQDLESHYRERPNVRRLRRRRDEIDEIFADDDRTQVVGARRAATLRPVGARGNGDVRVHLVVPKSFNDAQQVADRFKESVPVILNLQGTETDLAKRLIDFASGLTYALDGGMQKIADKVFMLTPRNVEISAEERARLIERASSTRPEDGCSQSEAMQIGLIGAGAMARALARGWRRPLLVSDPIHERAQALAAECGGEALPDNREVARRADLIVLAHKPPQLSAVSAALAGEARAVASVLALTPLAELKQAYPGRPVYRFIPSLAAALRRGAIVQAADAPQDENLDAQVAGAFAELGELVVLEDSQLDCAMALMSCAPAYVALIAEAQIDAGVRRGIAPAPASKLVLAALDGSSALLRERQMDTLALRREVSSPGGATARGLDALERGGVRSAFSAALDAALGTRT
jgi:pyrroline-5-carboxylate reductase